ncbi:glutamate-5-semialdehyde dehydrogenase [Aureococcus anophagefferens]|nr:glutamate-5-semialdehyde dehydrogenase [Aureococcus anophagefferens]
MFKKRTQKGQKRGAVAPPPTDDDDDDAAPEPIEAVQNSQYWRKRSKGLSAGALATREHSEKEAKDAPKEEPAAAPETIEGLMEKKYAGAAARFVAAAARLRKRDADQLQSATRIVIKAGTSTVSNDDGTPSLVRLGGIVEAIARLMRDNKQVILVSSGAVGCGRSKLRKQSSLSSIVGVGMLPIVNENDAVSGNSGYANVPAGCFSDNDGLAALVAQLFGAELLILLTDVDGLYDRPPSAHGAKIIREVHPASLSAVEFGPVSKGGRGGMEAKVGAALRALEMGVKGVVMASGTTQNVVGRLMGGEDLGTYFSTSISGRRPDADLREALAAQRPRTSRRRPRGPGRAPGSNDLVKHVQKSTKVPVLGHADGVCHVYVDASADAATAVKVVVDAKTDYPAACNACETVLFHEACVASGLAKAVLDALVAEGVALFGGPGAVARGLVFTEADKPEKWEYGCLALRVDVVPDVAAAVAHVNAHSSGHTECVVAEDAAVADAFLGLVDSADVFHNASTRFADGFRFGLGAELGIATGRIHARGPVGVDGFLTYKWLLRSASAGGDAASEFGSGATTYTHKDLALAD